MSNPSKQKGDRAERAIVETMRAHGLDAYRIPLSGASKGFKCDVEIRLGNQTLKVESKCRSGTFTRIYRWLAGSDFLVLKADREQPLAVIPLESLAKLISQIPHNPIEQAASKPSPDPYPDSPQQTIDPEVVLLHDDKVYLNKPRYTPFETK